MKYVSLLWLFLPLIATSHGETELDTDEVSDFFFEVDVRKLQSIVPIEFGAQLYTLNHTRQENLIKKFGPVFKTGYWQNVWEVSGVAPAPRRCDDDEMSRWVGSIYWNLAGDIESMENMSRSLQDMNVQVISGTITAPNTYYSSPKNVKRFREIEELEKQGIKVELEEWTPEQGIKDAEDETKDQVIFMNEFINDFAKFWATSLEYLEGIKLRLPYIELSYEPDSKVFMYVEPQDYVEILKKVREEMKARNISDDKHRIVGPGSSHPTAAGPYIEALGQDREAYDVLYAWNFHITDDGKSLQEIEMEIYGFRQLLKAMIPKSWPKKQIFVSSFKYHPELNLAFDDVEFSGDIDKCYQKIMGRFRTSNDSIPNSVPQSPVTGVRLLASLFLQYSLGVSKSVYESIADQNWSYACPGIFDRLDRHKQIFASFSTFLPYIEEGSVAIKKQWSNSETCHTVALKSKTRIIFAVANTGSTSCQRSFSLSGVNTNKISEAFSVSYNNGTVSLTAADASEALIMKQPLDYDVFPSEEKKDDHVVEFDLVIGPHASGTAVLELKSVPVKEEDTTVGENAAEAKTEHTEL